MKIGRGNYNNIVCSVLYKAVYFNILDKLMNLMKTAVANSYLCYLHVLEDSVST